jgi:hypothetical protein
MGTLAEDLSAIKTIETGLVNNKVANFAYTDTAYAEDTVNGTPTYDPNAENNIPTADPSVLKVNSTVLQRGWRAKASSITRMLMNHFLGRISYNLNKLNDNMKSLLDTLDKHYGTANGYATLDDNGRIPYSQLPESALEYKGDWDASTNTPTLADGNGTLGDMYIVSVAGTQNLGSGSIDFIENDRVIYNGSVWQKLSGGSVRSVNSVMPDGTGNISISGDNILTAPFSSANLQVSLKDKTIRQVHCKGQAGEGIKMLLGYVPLTYSSVFLLTFDTDNTWSGAIKFQFSNGALAGSVWETEYNGAVTSSTNWGIKAGTYIARLVQRSSAPNGVRVAIEGEYNVYSARTAGSLNYSKDLTPLVYSSQAFGSSIVEYRVADSVFKTSVADGDTFIIPTGTYAYGGVNTDFKLRIVLSDGSTTEKKVLKPISGDDFISGVGGISQGFNYYNGLLLYQESATGGSAIAGKKVIAWANCDSFQIKFIEQYNGFAIVGKPLLININNYFENQVSASRGQHRYKIYADMSFEYDAVTQAFSNSTDTFQNYTIDLPFKLQSSYFSSGNVSALYNGVSSTTVYFRSLAKNATTVIVSGKWFTSLFLHLAGILDTDRAW